MKEVVQYSLPPKRVVLPDQALNEFLALAAGMKRRSTLLWGEHCSECGFPHCYSSCSFYLAREDYHCRRFEEGLRTVSVDRLELVGVKFGKWGKLEAEGKGEMYRSRTAEKREGRMRNVSNLINLIPVNQDRKNRLAKHANNAMRTSSSEHRPDRDDLFIIEAYSTDDKPISFTLTLRSKDESKPIFYQTGFDLNPGYNRLAFPVSEIQSYLALDSEHLVQIEPLSEQNPAEIYFGILDFVSFENVQDLRFDNLQAPEDVKADSKPDEGDSKLDKKVKCVVWDLDNTVWDGTLAEDGVAALKIRPQVIEMMHKLDARGIINSVASKNDLETGLAALEHFGLQDMVLYPQIGWHPKSKSIQTIADSIGIGLNTFVFLDDQSFERAEVREHLAEVECLDANEAAHLLERSRFDVPATPEAASRRLKYKDEEKRVATFLESGQQYISFLEGCEIKLKLLPLTDERLTRAYELSQRTNQLNFSGRRYEVDELKSMQKQPDKYEITLMQCTDRFGDYGVIGLAVLDLSASTLESFMMSCRVKGKMVEHAFYAHALNHLQRLGKDQLSVTYKKTERNHASVQILDDLGFEPGPTQSGQTIYTRSTSASIEGASVVQIEDLREEQSVTA